MRLSHTRDRARSFDNHYANTFQEIRNSLVMHAGNWSLNLVTDIGCAWLREGARPVIAFAIKQPFAALLENVDLARIDGTSDSSERDFD